MGSNQPLRKVEPNPPLKKLEPNQPLRKVEPNRNNFWFYLFLKGKFALLFIKVERLSQIVIIFGFTFF